MESVLFTSVNDLDDNRLPIYFATYTVTEIYFFKTNYAKCFRSITTLNVNAVIIIFVKISDKK